MSSNVLFHPINSQRSIYIQCTTTEKKAKHLKFEMQEVEIFLKIKKNNKKSVYINLLIQIKTSEKISFRMKLKIKTVKHFKARLKH